MTDNRKRVETEFGSFLIDDRVPPNEVWMYTDTPSSVECPDGRSILLDPDYKIVNIGGSKKD